MRKSSMIATGVAALGIGYGAEQILANGFVGSRMTDEVNIQMFVDGFPTEYGPSAGWLTTKTVKNGTLEYIGPMVVGKCKFDAITAEATFENGHATDVGDYNFYVTHITPDHINRIVQNVNELKEHLNPATCEVN